MNTGWFYDRVHDCKDIDSVAFSHHHQLRRTCLNVIYAIYLSCVIISVSGGNYISFYPLFALNVHTSWAHMVNIWFYVCISSKQINQLYCLTNWFDSLKLADLTRSCPRRWLAERLSCNSRAIVIRLWSVQSSSVRGSMIHTVSTRLEAWHLFLCIH